jgi:serine/threonine protein kinase/Tfp pilus assembly protein PilF
MTVFQPIQFGKYKLLDKIAVGGMAELYRAKLTGVQGFEKLIAIKKILPHLSDQDSLITSFIDEAKLAALLHHENIVQIYDFGNMDNEYFIAMEFLFGKDLRTIRKVANTREQPLDMGNILYIISRICAGLDYSHNLKDLQGKPLNIIHRDINPQNILVTYEGQVKIIDYGIAKAASQNNKTRENLIKGKLAYMSPEQANGQTIDHRSDIFSTGIVLYELLADRRMFEGETMHVLSLVREAHFDPPEEVIPDLSAELNQILHRALAKDPDERYQSASEMLADLEEFAFELSLRPNARSFAQYIKELFEEEFAEEELALWAKSKIYEAGETEDEDQNSEAAGTCDSTAICSQPYKREKLSQIRHALYRETWLKLAGVLGVKRKNTTVQEKPGRDLAKWGFKLTTFKPVAVILVFLVVVALGIQQISFSRSHPEDRPSASQKVVVVAEPLEFSKLHAGRAALEAKRFTLAVTLFEEIIAGDPAMMRKVSEYYVRASLGQAAELLDTNPDEALNTLLKALKIDPDNISGLSNLGYVYMGQQNYPKAIETYLKVAGLAPHIPDTYFNLGYVYAVTGKYHKSKEMYRRVVDLNPAFKDEALFNLAVVNEKLGEHTKCIKNLERAVAFNPGNESAQKYLRRLKEKTGEKKG